MSETEATTNVSNDTTLSLLHQEMIDQAAHPEPLCDELAPYICEPEPRSKLGWTCLKHPLVFAVPYMPALNYQYNRSLRAKQNYLTEARSKKDWGQYVFLHERAHRFDALYQIRNEMTGEEYWDVLGSIWTDSENLWQVGADRLRKMLSFQKEYRHLFMDGDEHSLLNQLPDQFRVFRGHSKHNRHGFSWTLSYSKACWFSRRLKHPHDPDSLVSHGLVSKDHVKGLLMGRGEMEIVVSSRAVQNPRLMAPVQRPHHLKVIRDDMIKRFALTGRTDHGPDHWDKVARNGQELCKLIPAADPAVVQLFAIVHDSCRRSEGSDPGHGPRAATLIADLRKEGQLPWLSDEQFKTLEFAVRKHNGHGPVPDSTVGVCFDSDRLDLLRVGVVPNPRLLSTEAAKSLIGLI